MVGSTNCVPLINGYLDADNDFMDALHADGAVAGYQAAAYVNGI